MKRDLEVKIFDTCARTKSVLDDEHVRLYVCGPTVYQRAHIGNARPYIVFAWLSAFLRDIGREVTFVHNLTDVNDKIYAASPGDSASLAARAAAWYLEDIARFELTMPDSTPKVTEYVPKIVDYIEQLIDAGAAYEIEGDVYFRVAADPDYGVLSGRHDVQPEDHDDIAKKRDPRDFALWKATKAGEDTHWRSPWGEGRPGWHIECTVMAESILGEGFAIHGSGIDIVFPHNENERAQARGLGRDYAKHWMHNGMLQLAGDKMSKSIGNIVTIQEALDRWGAPTLLMLFASGHWRHPLDYSDEQLRNSQARLTRLNRARSAEPIPPDVLEREWGRFLGLLADDFNTPGCLALIHEWARDGRGNLVDRGLSYFGITKTAEAEAPEEVHEFARQRRALRSSGDFAAADALRERIRQAGWDARDVAHGDGYDIIPLPPTNRRQ